MSGIKVVIFGATGMLGATTLDVFAKDDDFKVTATYHANDRTNLAKKYPNVKFVNFDAESAAVDDIAKIMSGAKWAVNAIGVIKPYIHDDNAKETERAVRVNTLFLHNLGKATEQTGTKVIQIATDCVYSGDKGKYVESDVHDATDVYGKTKSLGEVYSDNILNIRCSIIGPELKSHLSLMDWFLGQKKDAEVNGFTNHQWNGITTLHFARLAKWIIKSGISFDHLQHIVPGSMITKANLLKSFAKHFGRDDITVNPVEAPKVIDRTLSTENQSLNDRIWKAAGYDAPPSVEQMVGELAEYGLGAAA